MALDQVNLKVKDGELFGLLGPNSAGKTTFIKILCTLILPTNGTAIINGFDVVKDREAVIKSIGVMLPEMRGFYWRLKGRENLEIYARLFGLEQSKERVKEVISLVGLSKDDVEKRYQKYSSGMKQKLALAKALLPDPDLLLMDDLTQGIDIQTAINIRRFIREDLSRGEGKTILFTTHNLLEAERLCDRIAIIDKGKIRVVGTPDEIKRMAKEPSLEGAFLSLTRR